MFSKIKRPTITLALLLDATATTASYVGWRFVGRLIAPQASEDVALAWSFVTCSVATTLAIPFYYQALAEFYKLERASLEAKPPEEPEREAVYEQMTTHTSIIKRDSGESGGWNWLVHFEHATDSQWMTVALYAAAGDTALGINHWTEQPRRIWTSRNEYKLWLDELVVYKLAIRRPDRSYAWTHDGLRWMRERARLSKQPLPSPRGKKERIVTLT